MESKVNIEEKMRHWEAWKAKNAELTARILKERGGKFIDVDKILEEHRKDLEGRHDYLFGE
jgi:hypothetical protein